jgi:hypothetical protein
MRSMELAMIRSRGVHAMVLLAVATLVAVMLFVPRVTQDPRYHQFADQRTLVARIPNTLNVVSNVVFMAVGIIGLMVVRRHAAGAAAATFFLGTLATFLGSSWYHLAPGDGRLVYDRSGMIICFAAIVAMLLDERLGVRHSMRWLLAIGAASIIWWQLTGDLRPYGFVQFFPMLLIILLLLFTKPRYTHTWTIVALAALYAVAKAFELADAPIYRALGVSGHTLKHIVAGAATGMVAWWVAARKPSTAA